MFKLDSEMNLFILKNQSNGFSDCFNPGIDKTIHSNFQINAGGIDAIHFPGNWYFYQSDYIYSNEDEYEWFAVKGKDISGAFGSQEYLYIDDVSVTTRDFCDHPCAPSVDNVKINPGSNGVVIPNAMQINVNPWHVYVENAIYIDFTVFNSWGGIAYHREDYDPNTLKDSGFFWIIYLLGMVKMIMGMLFLLMFMLID